MRTYRRIHATQTRPFDSTNSRLSELGITSETTILTIYKPGTANLYLKAVYQTRMIQTGRGITWGLV